MSKKQAGTSLRGHRERMQARQQQQRRLYYTIAAIGTLIIIGFFALAGQINAPSLDDVVLPESLETPPNADGKTWGPADAPVIIEEFGDFQ